MTTTTPQTLDQQRAAFAWKCVAKAKVSLGGKFDAYTNLAKSAPALIMGNGLMATLAFLQQKKDGGSGKIDEAKELNRAICTWLYERMGFIGDGYAEVMEGLHGADSAAYLRATEEALELLRWLRQFAPTLKE